MPPDVPQTTPGPAARAPRTLLAGLRAALFDLDNTLVETHIDFPAMKRDTLAFVEQWGLDPQPFADRDILGVVEAARDELRARRGTGEAERFRAGAFALLAQIEERECAAPVELPGAADVLRLLRDRGVPVAVVTRNCRRVSEKLCARFRLPHDALLSRDDTPRAKPHPDHLRAALHALAPGSTPPPASVLMAGDNVMDIQAGRALGARAIGFRRGKPAAHFAPCPPDLLLEDMAELWERMKEEG